MKHFFRFSFFAAAFLFLTGCSVVRTQVTTYYTPSFSMSGKTYAFYKGSGSSQADNLQYAYFSQRVKSKLNAMGMREAPLRQADYTAVLSYRIGKRKKETGYRKIYGQTGTEIVGKRTHDYYHHGDYDQETTYEREPRYGVVGVVPYKYYNYPYVVKFSLYRHFTGSQRAPVYNATITAVYPAYMPNKIFGAMFSSWLDNFPGENGGTQTVNAPISG